MPLFHRSSSKERKLEPPSPSTQPKEDEPSLLSRLNRKYSHEASTATPTQEGHHTTPSHPPSGPPSPVSARQHPSIGISVTSQSTDSDRRQRHHHAHSRSDSPSREHSSSETRSETKESAYPSLGDDGKHDAAPMPLLEKVTDGLTRDDIKLLFSGAPYFMLEPGRRHRAFPQSYFPFTSPLEITDLQDRLYTQHESFTLSSLHAHLPVPFEIGKDGGSEHALHQPDPMREIEQSQSQLASPQTPQQQLPAIEGRVPETTKRPMFDMSIYERPNMLSLHGVEPGTVGMRNFLERPVADGLVTHGREEHGAKDSDIGSLSLSQEQAWEGADEEGERQVSIEKLPGWEGYRSLARDSGARIGKHAPRQDRVQLLKGGPHAWKNIGIRPITMKKLATRLEQVSFLRDTVVKKGWRYTILDEVGAAELGRDLFGEEAGFLFPPSSLGQTDRGKDSGDLKVQIEILVKILTTPGAWLDFSLPAERLLFAQNLYTKEVSGEDLHGITPHQKRKWSLIQLVLAIELVMRLDAALRKGVATRSKDLVVENAEIRKFNSLRNLKVDWDLVVARRWLDLCFARRIDVRAGLGEGTLDEAARGQNREHGEKEERQREKERGLLTKMKHSLSFRRDQEHDQPASSLSPEDTDYDVAVLPRQPLIMAQGLLRFAADIAWPPNQLSLVRESLLAKIHHAPLKGPEEMLYRNVESLSHPHIPQHAMDKSTVELRAATQKTLGGPLSLAWLGGLVVPGYFSCDVLMCTLLESDPEAVGKLGAMALVRSGFVLRGRSWWSKTCTVGTVMAAVQGAKERMGWIGLPDEVGPVDGELRKVEDGWRSIECEQQPRLRIAEGERIFDGERLAKESSPLGVGRGGVRSAEFEMLTDRMLDELCFRKGKLEVGRVQLILAKSQDHENASKTDEYLGSVGFQVFDHTGNTETQQLRIFLRYNVRFVGAHPCKPPHGHVHLHPLVKTQTQSQMAGATAPATEVGSSNEADASELSRSETTTTDALLSPVTTITSSASAPSPTITKYEPDHNHPSIHRVHKHEHIPAHPLHRSYKYTLKSLEDIIELHQPHQIGSSCASNIGLPGVEADSPGGVWIVDARGGCARNVLARAWCASVGRDAIVSRVGKGCLSCAIREARALEIGVVIRVG